MREDGNVIYLPACEVCRKVVKDPAIRFCSQECWEDWRAFERDLEQFGDALFRGVIQEIDSEEDVPY